MAKCLECTHWKPCFNGKEWDAAIASPCKYFAPDIIVGGKTNADRIRAMSDEELAAFIEGESWMCCTYDSCDECPMRKTRGICFSVVEWLKQPVKDGEDDGRT